MILTAGKLFSGSKKKTNAYTQYPKKVREALNIVKIKENGIFKIEPQKGKAIYDACYMFDDINYKTQDNAVKKNTLLQIMQWLNSMNADFKIGIANHHQSSEQFYEEVVMDTHRDEYPEIAEGIQAWTKDKLSVGTQNVKKVRYLIITCRATSFEEAQIYLNGLDTQIQRLFLGWKSNIYRLNAKERLKPIQSILQIGREELLEPQTLEDESWKNDVLPTTIETQKDHMILDDNYVSVLFARQYDSSLDEGKVISGFSEAPFPSWITLDYAPIDRIVLKDKLANSHMNNETAIAKELEQKKKAGQLGENVSYTKANKKAELEAYRDQIYENNESSFFIGLLIVVTGRSLKELVERKLFMINTGKENGVTLETYNYRQLKALNTALPFGGRQVDHMRSFLTSSAVALHPYYAQDLQDAGGCVYGLNRTTKQLVVGNRKLLKNPHAMIVGHSGSGKSMIKKIELGQVLLGTDDDINVIDPQNEFKDICDTWNGEFFDFTAKSKMHINPLEISEEVFYSEDVNLKHEYVANQTEFTTAFCAAIMRNITVTQEHRSVISRCTRNVYEEIFKKDKLKTKDQPTLKTLRAELKKEMDKASNEEDRSLIRKIYNSLEEYTEGAYDMFAHHSNLNINKRLVVFGLKNVTEAFWEPVMITIMHFLSNRMEYNQKLRKATRLIIDETQVVCTHKSSADMLLRAVVTFRKFGGICSMLLQNLTRALENPELRDMFSNCAFKLFLDQGGVDAQALSVIQELSAEEFQSLDSDLPGHGVMIWSKKVILLDSYMDKSNVLYDQLSTNFHEQAEQTKQVTIEKVIEPSTIEEKTEENDMQQENQTLKQSEKIQEEILQITSITAVTLDEIALAMSMEKKDVEFMVHKLKESDLLKESNVAEIVYYEAS